MPLDSFFCENEFSNHELGLRRKNKFDSLATIKWHFKNLITLNFMRCHQI